jgi:hypothetical protein
MPKTIDFHFNPSEYGILNDYSVVKEIYRVMLSPTIITLTTHKETNMVRLRYIGVIHVDVDPQLIFLLLPFVIYLKFMLSSLPSHSNN